MVSDVLTGYRIKLRSRIRVKHRSEESISAGSRVARHYPNLLDRLPIKQSGNDLRPRGDAVHFFYAVNDTRAGGTGLNTRVRVRDVDRSRGETIAHIRIHAPGASHNIIARDKKIVDDSEGSSRCCGALLRCSCLLNPKPQRC